VYEASADVLINRQEAATTTLIGETPALDDPNRTMETQTLLARTRPVVEGTIGAAGVPGWSVARLRKSSSVFSEADILHFIVAADQPARAARLASQYAREFVRYRRELDTVGLEATLREVRDQIEDLEASGDVGSPLYVRHVDRERQLESLAALRMSNVSVVETATAGDAEQVAPRPRRNLALALVAGLIVGLILVALWETLSTKPRTEHEVEALLGMPFLARLKFRGRSPLGTQAASGPDADEVHTLRVNLELASSAAGARTIMITSALSGEGKSVTTLQLARALARAGRRVTLVDLDLRTSALTTLMGLDDRPGITSVVQGECKLTDALVAISVDPVDSSGASADTNGRRDVGAYLEAVGSGPRRGHPSEISSSTALSAVLAELEQRADVVLVEAAPVLDFPDAAAVAPRLDGLLLVVSDRDARGPVLAEVRRAVEGWPLLRLGFALTDGGDALPHGRQVSFGMFGTRAKAGEKEQVA
jgi:Mrp family chromosome partitioning ATPase